ncbi:hypothetical protein [Deinococcus sp.]|uniref:hypothetical protein n=1 Tax=Deinococcus sp. TaxID=47478 RepID=UPI003C7CBAF8
MTRTLLSSLVPAVLVFTTLSPVLASSGAQSGKDGQTCTAANLGKNALADV